MSATTTTDQASCDYRWRVTIEDMHHMETTSRTAPNLGLAFANALDSAFPDDYLMMPVIRDFLEALRSYERFIKTGKQFRLAGESLGHALDVLLDLKLPEFDP